MRKSIQPARRVFTAYSVSRELASNVLILGQNSSKDSQIFQKLSPWYSISNHENAQTHPNGEIYVESRRTYECVALHIWVSRVTLKKYIYIYIYVDISNHKNAQKYPNGEKILESALRSQLYI